MRIWNRFCLFLGIFINFLFPDILAAWHFQPLSMARKLHEYKPLSRDPDITAPPVLYGVHECTQAFGQYFSMMEMLSHGSHGLVFDVYDRIGRKMDFVMKAIPLALNASTELAISTSLSRYVIEESESPNFVKTLDFFRCNLISMIERWCPGCEYSHHVQKLVQGGEFRITNMVTHQFIIYEKAKGPSLQRELLKRFSLGQNFEEFLRASLFQIISALNVAYKAAEFGHFDLFPFNMRFDSSLSSKRDYEGQFFEYDVGGTMYRIPKSATGGSLIKLIDYGMSGILMRDPVNKFIGSSKALVNRGPAGITQNLRHLFSAITCMIPEDIYNEWQKQNSRTAFQFLQLFRMIYGMDGKTSIGTLWSGLFNKKLLQCIGFPDDVSATLAVDMYVDEANEYHPRWLKNTFHRCSHCGNPEHLINDYEDVLRHKFFEKYR